MQEITLQALLEAGCHFGHKSERWHPKAAEFIYTEKDGIHIIDLAKTKAGLDAATNFVRDLVASGQEILFVGTKRQAAGIVKMETNAVGAPYLSERWIGGFLTNWDNIHRNIEKINRMTEERANGSWKKFPKHEQTKMGRYVDRIKIYYGGVLTLDEPPAAIFVVDIRKEDAAVREGKRRGIPVIGIVDTNANPEGIDYVIPANDDAVGSISFIVHAMAEAYKEGKALAQKGAEIAAAKAQAEAEKVKVAEEKAAAAKAAETAKPKPSEEAKAALKPKKETAKKAA